MYQEKGLLRHLNEHQRRTPNKTCLFDKNLILQSLELTQELKRNTQNEKTLNSIDLETARTLNPTSPDQKSKITNDKSTLNNATP